MSRIAYLFVFMVVGLLVAQPGFSQKGDIGKVVAHKWRVIWFSDDGVEKNMEDKKQQLILRPDGSGEMFMMGQKIGDVVWTVAEGKDQITFQDDPTTPAYLVKVSKYKKGKNMLFTGTLPTGVERKVYFEILSGK
jgi:hypothetical protein